MPATGELRMPSPDLFMLTARAYQGTSAIKAAINLDVFTAIGEGAATASEIGQRCGASQRGTRILCDFLVILGFLTKDGAKYALTQDSAVFLDRRSPMCVASAANFICDSRMTGMVDSLTDAVRKGGTAMLDGGTTTPENLVWVQFAESMAALMTVVAGAAGHALGETAARATKVLDIAAGHGMFGITLAQQNPKMQVVGLDWPQVLEVAKRNAQKSGVADRYTTLAGSAFDVDFGTAYDLILLPNFLHHFSVATNTKLLKKVHAALAPGGRIAIMEFVPNEDRVTPAEAGSFALTMLASTAEGDAYTFRELEGMCRGAGFSNATIQALPMLPTSLIVAEK
jgi:2-polyprenyl-3-methyl-5-hydroxy-6-metoxy-1,4-benzoquinol methylase